MNRLAGIFLSLVALLSLFSCGPGEVYHIEEGYVSSIYTVNKATLQPEFEDTLYRVTNHPNDFGLETGDRAHILLHYYFDAYSGKQTEWDIVQVIEKIPTLDISPRESIDTASYDLPFSGLDMYELYGAYVRPEWVWNNRINVNVKYNAVPEKTHFAMTVCGISNDTIKLNLLAKTEQTCDSVRTKLLSYDLNNISDLLTDDEKSAVNGYEKLKFRVYLKYKDIEGKLHNNSFPIIVGDIANPLRK